MKLSILLAQYFYQHKQLNLPGIGSFHLDAAVTVPDANDKNFREFAKYIQFTQQPIAKPDDALIDFIRTHTGKIRPLAESDLESYLSDGKLLLNIGKPFHIEGIGTLHKNKLGIYEFAVGEPITERIDVVSELREVEKSAPKKKSAFDDSYSQIEAHHNKRRRLLIGTLIVIGLAVVLWGGYSLYNNRKDENAIVQQAGPAEDTPAAQSAPDTTTKMKTDSTLPAASAAPPGNYKFIMETTGKKNRALGRMAQLADLKTSYRLETSDSLTFNITVTLPATPADTTRLKDSLNAWYYGTKPIKVRIAQ